MEKKGPIFNLRVFWGNFLITTSPDLLKLILATDFDNYVKGQTYLPPIGIIRKTTLSNAGARSQQRMKDFLGVGIFNSDGELNRLDFISKMTQATAGDMWK